MATIDPHGGDNQLGRGRRPSALGLLAGPAWGLAMVLGVVAFALLYCIVNAVSLGYRLIAAGMHRFGPRRG